MKKLLLILVAASVAVMSASCKKDNPPKEKVLVPEPDAIDIGMVLERADGTTYKLKWASFNLGASKEYEFGNYYAWGETEPKEDYSWGTYKYANGYNDKLTKYCVPFAADRWDVAGMPPDNLTKLLPSDDAAHVNLGGKWRMPTVEEWDALVALRNNENFKFEWYMPIDDNGNEIIGANNAVTYCLKISMKNPPYNYILLPAARYREGTEWGTRGTNPSGFYWTSSLYKDYANTYSFSVPDVYVCNASAPQANLSNSESRCCGLSIRPVCEE